ncbi:MAG: DUF6075 family protein, partial [Candidatus Woesearchaeota archaeon]
MENLFLSESHKEKYLEIMDQAGVSKKDNERAALFYILTGHYKYRDNIELLKSYIHYN